MFLMFSRFRSLTPPPPIIPKTATTDASDHPQTATADAAVVKKDEKIDDSGGLSLFAILRNTNNILFIFSLLF
ncbi:hypothetical protein M5689_020982 [Euphorbia peplus]|nr:hypothetical protein M5689_020982 [Euphorbia peplus]